MNLSGILKLALRARQIGWKRVEYQLNLLRSGSYLNEVAKRRKISPQALKSIVNFLLLFFQLKKIAFNSILLITPPVLKKFIFGQIGLGIKRINPPKYFWIDQPIKLFFFGKKVTITGWSVDLSLRKPMDIRVRIHNKIYPLQIVRREEVAAVFRSVCEIPLDVGFGRTLDLPRGVNRFLVEVLNPEVGWEPVRRFYIFNLKIFKKKKYASLAMVKTSELVKELGEIEAHIKLMYYRPSFTLIIDVRNGIADWQVTLESIKNQIYPACETFVLTKGEGIIPSGILEGLHQINVSDNLDFSGEFLVVMEPGEALSINALYEFANELNRDCNVDIIYGDEDEFSSHSGFENPFYKPEWSPDYLETFNYIRLAACYRTEIAISCLKSLNRYDFCLRITELTNKIKHINEVLGHSRIHTLPNHDLKKNINLDILALNGRLARTGRKGVATHNALYPGSYDLKVELAHKPLVSIVIPSAGKVVGTGQNKIDLIINVISQIRNKSTYKNIEIIIVDNGDLSTAQLNFLKENNCLRFSDFGLTFNLSRKFNIGASKSSGEYLLLLNDDIEIRSNSWIEDLIEHFEKPHVGVVGAKLLYPDKTIQHAGVVHSDGSPQHVRRFYPSEEAGYFYSTSGVRNYSAVTGAAMMTSSKLYREIGGYDEELTVFFNDIDYCLKVVEMGFSIVYAPKAVLIHMESQSVSIANNGDQERYQKKWGNKVYYDKYYNNFYLDNSPPNFEIS